MNDRIIIALVRDQKEESLLFAKALAEQNNIPLHIMFLGRYADGETALTCSTIKTFQAKNVLIVDQYSCEGSQNAINAQVLELLFALDAIRLANVKSMKLFVPYLPYARHDVSEFGYGLGLVGTLFGCLRSVGVAEIYACDIHEPAIASSLSVNLVNFGLDVFWADFLTNLGIRASETILASPDQGGLLRVKKVAARLGLGHVLIKKERYGSDKTRVVSIEGSVRGKNVVVLDDIIDTAGTAINAASCLIEQGARDIIGCFSHGVFSSGAAQRLNESVFSKVYTTNTIFSAVSHQSDKITVLSLQNFIAQLGNNFF